MSQPIRRTLHLEARRRRDSVLRPKGRMLDPVPTFLDYGIQDDKMLGDRNPTRQVGGAEPQVGDVVSCWYPHDGARRRRGPKLRPCPVIGTRLGETTTGAPVLYVVVAYGTTQALDGLGEFEFVISDDAERKAVGINHPTKFSLGQRRWVTLPYVHHFFQADKDGGAILGTLPPRYLRMLVDAVSPNIVERKVRRFEQRRAVTTVRRTYIERRRSRKAKAIPTGFRET
jgi:hypothetical protein